MEKTPILSTHHTVFQKSVHSVNENEHSLLKSTVSRPSSVPLSRPSLFFVQHVVQDLPLDSKDDTTNPEPNKKHSFEENGGIPSSILAQKNPEDIDQNVNSTVKELTGDTTQYRQ